MKVLSTKTLDSKTIVYAHSLNLDVHGVDFIKIEKAGFDLHSIQLVNADTIAFTSANAVKYFFQDEKAVALLKDKKVLSLSGKTKEALLGNTIEPIFTADNSDDLAFLIIQMQNIKSVLHICGNLALGVLEEKLKKEGIAYNQLVVYQTILQKDLALNENFDAVMLYSPSGVESFFTSNPFNISTVYCCIGVTTASSLKEKYNDAKIILPQQTSPESMIEAIKKYFESNLIKS
jgi:uroporphyrinogen-III synthase